MRKFDTYTAKPQSMRSQVLQSQHLQANVQRTPQRNNSVVSPTANQKQVQTSALSSTRQNYNFTLNTQNGAVQPSSIALQAVRHASPSHDDVLAEQFTGQVSMTRKRSLSRAQKIFYGIGITIFLFATLASIQTILVNNNAKEQLQVLGTQTQKPDEYGVTEGTGSEPAEAEVPKSALSAYKVNPELPRYLRIPDIGVFARIKHTGVDKSGAIDAPANINDVSWYNESARPGNEIGSSLLLGHVSGWTAPGVFKKINQLKSGMRFEVEKGSGEKLQYEVTRAESLPVEGLDMSKILATEVAGEHDLKLMTCSGRYNKEKDHYEERYVVYAKILR